MKEAIRAACSKELVKLAAENDKIVVLDADVATATKTSIVREACPDRHFDFGIAEANMYAAAAGMAKEGLIPFACTFAVFATGRAFEIIRNSIAYVNANVKIAVSHSGISVAEDGGSHQTIEDIALMRVLPNMTIFVPCDGIETRKAVRAAAAMQGSVMIRLARPESEIVTKESTPFVPGKANVLRRGEDVALFACGLMVPLALQAAEELEKKGVSAAVINMHTIKPLDTACILRYARKCRGIVTIEEHSVIGGLGSAVAETIAGKSDCGFERVGIEDRFGQSGQIPDLFEEYGLTVRNIIRKVKKAIR